MKKILYVILCMMLIFSMSSVVCFAEEAAIEQRTDETVPDTSEEAKTETIFTRLWEWLNDNKDTVLSVIGEGVLLVLMLKSRFKQKGIGTTLNSVELTTATTVNGQKAVVKKMDEMISEFNENKQTSEKLKEAEEHIEGMVATVSEMMLSLFEMMTMIHTQNRNLPQGTKDRVTQIFASCMKKVEEHDTLGTLSSGLKSSLDIIAKETKNDEQNEGQGA